MTQPSMAQIPLDKIKESPLNNRDPGNLDELVASVKAHGVLQPILTRQKNGGYELIFGRRRFRAAKLAGLEAIPATVREVTDEEALELILVENLQRAEVHPLDEADGYKQLHEKFKKSVNDIAATVGKSKAYIYARLKLCALAAGPRKLFLEGKLDASVALYVARIPDAKLQEKAAKEVGPNQWHDEPLSARSAQDLIQRNYMLKLAEAPFDVKDATLVPAAGTCEACPKRTGNQRELFADVQGANVCTDPTCYEKKRDASWQRQKEQAKTAGQAVLSEAKTKELFPYGNGHVQGKEYVDLDSYCSEDPKGRTYREVLGKHAPAPTLARTADGEVHELLPKAEAKAALVAKAEAKADAYPLRLAACSIVEVADLSRRWGEELSMDDVEARIGKMTEAQLRGLLLEGRLDNDQFSYKRGDKAADFEAACKHYGVDLKKLEAQAKAELEAAKKAPAEGKAGKKAKPAKAKKP